MSALREAAQQALDALDDGLPFAHLDNVVAPALRAALERQLTIEEIEDVWVRCGYTGRAPLGFARALARML
jgi:hypothetical protein